MNRWVWLSLCAFLGSALLGFGLLVPAHLRAVDDTVLRKAGKHTPGLVEHGLTLVQDGQLGAAQLVALAVEQEAVPGRQQFAATVMDLARQHPGWSVWGGGEYHLQVLFATDPGLPKSGWESFTEWVVRLENRSTVLELLRSASQRPAVQELLRCRALTNTVLFSPSESASGQALDGALSIAGLLLMEGYMAPGLSNTVFSAAAQANNGGSSQPLEQILLDLMSLGQRFNWGQLAAFAHRIDDPETLRLLTQLARRLDDPSTEGKPGPHLPILFSAVSFSGRPAAVAKYLMDYSQSGLNDVGVGLRYGFGALKLLLQREQRLYTSVIPQRAGRYSPFAAVVDVAAGYAWVMPGFTLGMKWVFLLAGGFFLALAVHFAWPAVSALERPLQVGGFHIARELLFGFGLLVLLLLFIEPYLVEGSQRVEFPLRLRLPIIGGAVPAGINKVKLPIMNEKSLMTLMLFFVLQALLYTASLVKLAEIRRQRVPARMKLKLLENEDHLFDAGLYLGFVGTIISLILFSLGVITPSLMAAYSSTSFGIIFVSLFKIFNLRPTRRRLLLEAEAAAPEQATPPAGRPVPSFT
jgi:hypothetical protein